MTELLEAVRRKCLPGPWSQGVRLARASAVVIESSSPSEFTARVRTPESAVPPTVTLFLSDEEWSCDCGGKVDPCAHVAAAAIAHTQGLAGPAASPAPRRPGSMPASMQSTPAHVAYQLGRRAGTLLFERLVVREGRPEEELRGTLASLVAARDTSLLPTHEDLAIDRMASGFRQGIVPVAKIPSLLELLESARDLRLDGHPMRASRERVVPRATIKDGPEGSLLVRIDKDPRVSEIVACGIVRVGETLRPMGAMELTGELFEKLPAERTFSEGDFATLVGEVLPALEARIQVSVKSARLPGRSGARVRPRILLELSQGFAALGVLPRLVYGDPPIARVDGGALVHLGGAVPLRDLPRERALTQELRDGLGLVPGRRIDFEGAEALRFAQRLREFGATTDDRERLFGHASLVPRVSISGDAVNVDFETEGQEDTGEGSASPRRRASVAAVLRAWQDGFDVVPLEGGGFAPLPSDWLGRYGHHLADLIAARAEDGTVSKAAMPALARFCEALELPTPPGFSELRPLFEGFTHLPEPELPPDLNATLRHYQHEGVAWLCFLRKARLGAVLADDMGLGKTLQALAALQGRALVVCPTSVLFNWAQEIARFRPGLRVATYHGPRRSLDPAAEITLTTYGTLRLDQDALASVSWDAVVLDEAQAIKNPDSQAARAAFALRGGLRVALSGTPIENRLEELWSLMHFANPGLLGGLSDFRSRYATPIGLGDARVAARLRDKIRPFLLRRKKSEVAPELPPRTDHLLYVELDEKERVLYDAVRAATKSELVSRLGEGLSVLEALEALLRLRQAACHSGLLPGHEAETSSKLERLVAELTCAAAAGHRALVFSQWTSLLDRAEPILTREGLSFLRLDGQTRDREGVVRAFQADDGPPVLLLSLKAGGTGLNLTAADHVFLLDPWWNPAAEDQAADRAHRIGQDKPVFVHRLVARDTVEERVLALQERKRGLLEAAVGDGTAAAALTRGDLMALLD